MTKKKLSRDLGWLTSKPEIIATGYDLGVYHLPDKTLFSLASEPKICKEDKPRTYRPGAITRLYDDKGKELLETEKLIVLPTGSICVFDDGKYILYDPKGKELFREETLPFPESKNSDWSKEVRRFPRRIRRTFSSVCPCPYEWLEVLIPASPSCHYDKHLKFVGGPITADISDKLYAGALEIGGSEHFREPDLLWLVFKDYGVEKRHEMIISPK